MIARLLRLVADVIDPPAKLRAHTADRPRAAAGTCSRSDTTIFSRSPELEAKRREDAMSLVDDDCHGYLLAALRDRQTHLEIDLSTALPDGAWPAMMDTLGRVVVEAEVRHG